MKEKMKNKTFKCDDMTWIELDKISKKLKISKSAIIRIAIIEKCQRIQQKGF